VSLAKQEEQKFGWIVIDIVIEQRDRERQGQERQGNKLKT
jgi:hypothetical protein